MKKFPFYFALAIGLVAFISLVTIYSYRTNKKALGTNQNVDLNEASQTTEVEEKAGKNDAEKKTANNPASQSAPKDVENINNTSSDKTDKTNADKADTDKATTDKATADKADTDKVTADKASTDKASTDKASTDKASTDKASTDKTNTEKEEIRDSENVTSVISDNAEPEKEEIKKEKTENELDYDLEYDGEKSLIWPVEGEVIMPFSMETTVFYKTLNAYKCSDAMLISGKEDELVLSSFEGVVTEIKDDTEIGTLVTVSLGNGYKLFYGQLKDVKVKVGDSLSLGQEIGRIAKPTRFYSKEGCHVYFKMTKEDNPENPAEHFK